MALAELLTTAANMGVKLVADGIRNRKASLEPDPGPDGDPDGCPACSVHRELAEAERLLAGVLRAWPGSEPAPAERRATVLLVRSNLDTAEQRLGSVREARAPVQELLGKLRECIVDARDVLPDRSDGDRAHWQEAHAAVARCWEMADEFAGEWFRPLPPGAAGDELEARVRALSPADRQRLLKILEQ